MKKYAKTFSQGHAINWRLAAMTVMALGISICSAFTTNCTYTVPGGECTPSVTVGVDGGAGSCTAAGVTVTCVGDDTSDTVEVQTDNNNPANNPVYSVLNSMAYITHTGDACDTTTWSNLVDIVAGVNKMTGHSCELGITSSEADVTSDNGYVWTYTRIPGPFYRSGGNSEGLAMHIVVSCLGSGTYTIYETPETDTACGFTIERTKFSEMSPLPIDGNGNGYFDDGLDAPPPPYTGSTLGCTLITPKTWHVYNTVTQLEMTESDDTVTMIFSSGSPRLTVSDSQVSPNQTFP